MPRVTYNIPAEQKQIEKEIIDNFGFYLNLQDVARYLGYSDRGTVRAWLADVPAVRLSGNRRQWQARKIAEKIYRCYEGT